MTRHKLPRKIDPWPKDWDMHILNTCDLYFGEDTSIFFLNGSSFYFILAHQASSLEDIKKDIGVNKIEVRLLFKINDRNYGVYLYYKHNNIIRGKVFYLIRHYINMNEIEKDIKIHKNSEILQSSHSILLIQAIKSFTCSSAYECIKKIEDIMLNDYKDREDGGEEDNEPIEPLDPVDNLSIDLNLLVGSF